VTRFSHILPRFSVRAQYDRCLLNRVTISSLCSTIFVETKPPKRELNRAMISPNRNTIFAALQSTILSQYQHLTIFLCCLFAPKRLCTSDLMTLRVEIWTYLKHIISHCLTFKKLLYSLLGILLYEMLYGYTPFRGKTRQKTFANILHKDLKFPKSKPVRLFFYVLLIMDLLLWYLILHCSFLNVVFLAFYK